MVLASETKAQDWSVQFSYGQVFKQGYEGSLGFYSEQYPNDIVYAIQVGRTFNMVGEIAITFGMLDHITESTIVYDFENTFRRSRLTSYTYQWHGGLKWYPPFLQQGSKFRLKPFAHVEIIYEDDLASGKNFLFTLTTRFEDGSEFERFRLESSAPETYRMRAAPFITFGTELVAFKRLVVGLGYRRFLGNTYRTVDVTTNYNNQFTEQQQFTWNGSAFVVNASIRFGK